MNNQIIEDVIESLKLTIRLRHRPMIDSIIEGAREALESTLILPPLPNSPISEPEEPVKSTGIKYRYVNFIADITPCLKSLYPGRSQKLNFSEGAKLWNKYKHLDDYESILVSAAAAATETAAIESEKDVTPK